METAKEKKPDGWVLGGMFYESKDVLIRNGINPNDIEKAKAVYFSPIEEKSKVIGMDGAYPLTDVLQRLIDASEYLLYKKDYDKGDYEEIARCVGRAKEIIIELEFSPVEDKTKSVLKISNANAHNLACEMLEYISKNVSFKAMGALQIGRFITDRLCSFIPTLEKPKEITITRDEIYAKATPEYGDSQSSLGINAYYDGYTTCLEDLGFSEIGGNQTIIYKGFPVVFQDKKDDMCPNCNGEGCHKCEGYGHVPTNQR